MSAHHSQFGTDAPAYSKDASSSYQMQVDNPIPANFVRKWRNITVQSTGNGEVMALLSGSELKEIAELPEYFVRDILQIKKKHPSALEAYFLLDAASTYITSEEPAHLLENALVKYPSAEAKYIRTLDKNAVETRTLQTGG
jgi:hypothetical protein